MTNKIENKSGLSKSGIWKGIALIAGIFSFVICVLIIANFFQINRSDPVNTEIMNVLVDRLNQDPTDTQLREQVRALDLLARKAYFTNQWQIRIGGYLLLMGIAVIVIAMQMLISDEKKKVLLHPQKDDDLLLTQRQTRKWITGFSATLVVITIVFAFMSHRQLGSKFQRAAFADTGQVVPVSGQQQRIEANLPQETSAIEVIEEVSPEENTVGKNIPEIEAGPPQVVLEQKITKPKNE
jgi:hypothetical protein